MLVKMKRRQTEANNFQNNMARYLKVQDKEPPAHNSLNVPFETQLKIVDMCFAQNPISLEDPAIWIAIQMALKNDGIQMDIGDIQNHWFNKIDESLNNLCGTQVDSKVLKFGWKGSLPLELKLASVSKRLKSVYDDRIARRESEWKGVYKTLFQENQERAALKLQVERKAVDIFNRHFGPNQLRNMGDPVASSNLHSIPFNQVHLPTEFILSSTGDMVSTVNEKQNLPNQCFRNIKFMIVERPGKLLDHSMAMLLEYWALIYGGSITHEPDDETIVLVTSMSNEGNLISLDNKTTIISASVFYEKLSSFDGRESWRFQDLIAHLGAGGVEELNSTSLSCFNEVEDTEVSDSNSVLNKSTNSRKRKSGSTGFPDAQDWRIYGLICQLIPSSDPNESQLAEDVRAKLQEEGKYSATSNTVRNLIQRHPNKKFRADMLPKLQQEFGFSEEKVELVTKFLEKKRQQMSKLKKEEKKRNRNTKDKLLDLSSQNEYCGGQDPNKVTVKEHENMDGSNDEDRLNTDN